MNNGHHTNASKHVHMYAYTRVQIMVKNANKYNLNVQGLIVFILKSCYGINYIML